jgi:catechol 2,3-dioxygenase-like lactoylglutathione lyase family enzyme
MNNVIMTGSVHHLTLTVSNVARSRDFYTRLLGFQVAMEFGSRLLLSNGSTIVAISPPDPERSLSNDRFDENRIGLDHLSFGVGSHNELEQAVRLFDANNVPHGDIKDLGPDLGIYVLAFRDPDNIQLELTAPYSG